MEQKPVAGLDVARRIHLLMPVERSLMGGKSMRFFTQIDKNHYLEKYFDHTILCQSLRSR